MQRKPRHCGSLPNSCTRIVTVGRSTATNEASPPASPFEYREHSDCMVYSIISGDPFPASSPELYPSISMSCPMPPLRIWIALMFTTFGSDLPGQQIQLSPDCVLRFANVTEAAEVLAAEDDFTRRLTRFDLQSRLRSEEELTVADYQQAVVAGIRPWTEPFVETVLPAAQQLADRLQRFDLPLPAEILLVYTSGKGESGAPHTRGNAIVLPEKRLARRPDDLLRLLAHELFHILTRQSPIWRDQMYATIGFQPCDEVRLSESQRDRRITNPDAPVVEHFITVQIDEADAHVAPVLIANVPQYDASRDAAFFSYLQVQFVQLQWQDGHWTPMLHDDGTTVGHPLAALDGFMSQIGDNTRYLIHPEEILADNFSFLVTGKNVPSPEVIDRIEALIAKP